LIKKVSASNILIFANSKNLLRKTADFLTKEGYKVATCYSDAQDPKRPEINESNINDFLKGSYRILTTTNL